MTEKQHPLAPYQRQWPNRKPKALTYEEHMRQKMREQREKSRQTVLELNANQTSTYQAHIERLSDLIRRINQRENQSPFEDGWY